MMSFSQFSRGFIRNYMFRRSRIGRSKFKKLLRKCLKPQQRVELEPGFLMDLDLTRENQEFLFWFHEELESSLQWAIRTMLPIGGTFVDCGGNAGLMGLLAMYWRSAKVIFIEPHPRLAETIRRNLQINQWDAAATVWECAASDREGTGSLFLDEKSDGGHSLSRTGKRDDGPSISVLTCRMEQLFFKMVIRHIDFLKVDTEGNDYFVLDGLGPFLRPDHLELIYVEMGEDYQRIWDLLKDRGYRPFVSEMIYIDQLRALRKKGDFTRFFSPIEEPGDGNLLWCGRDTPQEKFLLRACSTGP